MQECNVHYWQYSDPVCSFWPIEHVDATPQLDFIAARSLMSVWSAGLNLLIKLYMDHSQYPSVGSVK